jgi:hypothetical protein
LLAYNNKIIGKMKKSPLINANFAYICIVAH